MGRSGTSCAGCRKGIRPDLLVIETALSNSFEAKALEAGHLTPNLLRAELERFQKLNNYLPRVVLVHMTPQLEDAIRKEAAKVAKDLDASIELAHEGMLIKV